MHFLLLDLLPGSGFHSSPFYRLFATSERMEDQRRKKQWINLTFEKPDEQIWDPLKNKRLDGHLVLRWASLLVINIDTWDRVHESQLPRSVYNKRIFLNWEFKYNIAAEISWVLNKLVSGLWFPASPVHRHLDAPALWPTPLVILHPPADAPVPRTSKASCWVRRASVGQDLEQRALSSTWVGNKLSAG